MPLGIDPRIDFACKLMLGSPDHLSVTIHFLNSMLQLDDPVVAVKILNPIVGKDRSEDKLIVLDILARDSLGRLFNIEMHTRIPLLFPSRLLLYNSKNFMRQLREGDSYGKLRPAISICLLDRRMFTGGSENSRWYHSFRLRCDQNSELVLTSDFEFHIFELPKFKPTSDNISELPAVEKWLYLFKHAAEMEAETLADMLHEEPYREAIGVLKMISKSPEELQYYEDRLKFLRDEQGKLEAAREEGREEGLEAGREEGEQIGVARGREEGKMAGKIQVLQELLGEKVSADEELLALKFDSLATQLELLQERLRKRDS